MAKVPSASYHDNRTWIQWWRACWEEDLLLTSLLREGRAAEGGVRWDAEAWQHIEGGRKIGMAPERQRRDRGLGQKRCSVEDVLHWRLCEVAIVLRLRHF